MKMFEHTASEPGMWRGWTKGGQVLELPAVARFPNSAPIENISGFFKGTRNKF